MKYNRLAAIAFLGLSLVLLTLGINACAEGNTYKQGKILYTNACGNCHGANGEGLKELIPPLAKSDYFAKYKASLACQIYKGINGEIEVNGVKYNQPMVGVKTLNDWEITNVLNYISANWGNDKEFIKLEDVQKSLKDCKD
jgi:mono/diheme cytochrome c family protein